MTVELDADLRARIRRAKDESVRACLRSKQLRARVAVRRDEPLRDPDAPLTAPAQRPLDRRCGYCGEFDCSEHADLDEALDAL